MKGSTRKVVTAGAALVFGLAVTTAVMAQTNSPQKVTAPHTSMHKHHPSTLVKTIQEALNKQGAKLSVDGYMGKKTRAAIRTFQTAHKLKATGHADSHTRKALGLKG